jgi:hypothetical protein
MEHSLGPDFGIQRLESLDSLSCQIFCYFYLDLAMPPRYHESSVEKLHYVS